MRHEDVGEALDYLDWARHLIFEAAAGLTDAQFCSESTVTTRSLRATFVHQLECEWAWRVRLTEGTFPEQTVFAEDDFPTLPALAERWAAEEATRRAWFDTLSDEDLEAVPPGPGNTLARWRCLLYVVNHGDQQFAEAAVLLTRLGHSPGEIGYLAFCLRENALEPAPPAP